MVIKDAHKIRSHSHFECQTCGCCLEYRSSRVEQLIRFSAYSSLGVASALNLFASINMLPAMEITGPLYAVALILLAISIRNDFVNRRFYVSTKL